ncbi:hypothetical protein ABK040_001901 [Willaertia magna]
MNQTDLSYTDIGNVEDNSCTELFLTHSSSSSNLQTNLSSSPSDNQMVEEITSQLHKSLSFDEQLRSYRERHQERKIKQRNDNIGKMTTFLLATKHSKTLLPNEFRYKEKLSGTYQETTITNSYVKVSWRGKSCITQRKQPGDWFKSTVNQ